MKPGHPNDTINFNAVFIVVGSIAMFLAFLTALSIYGYMDHTQTLVSLQVGGHDSRCIHQQCWASRGRWGQH